MHGFYAQLCTKDYMPCRQTCTKEVAGRPGNRALWIELAKMLNGIVLHRGSIFGL
jgi:hypothetical protein